MIIFYRLCLIHVLGTQWYLVVCSMDMHPASYLHGHLWSESGVWEKGDMAHFHRTTSLTNWGSRLWSKVRSAPAQQVNTNYDQSTHEDRLQQAWRPKQNVSCFIILSFQMDSWVCEEAYIAYTESGWNVYHCMKVWPINTSLNNARWISFTLQLLNFHFKDCACQSLQVHHTIASISKTTNSFPR